MRRAVLLVSLLALALSIFPSHVLAANPPRVYYAGGDNRVKTALSLAGAFQLVARADQAQAIVVSGAIAQVDQLRTEVERGVGLVLLLSPDSSPGDLTRLFGRPITLRRMDGPVSPDQASGLDDEQTSDVIWSSAPQVRDRFQIGGIDLTPLAIGFETKETLLGETKIGQGRVLVLTPFLSDGANPQIQDWAYFNYLIYQLATRAAGHVPQSFAQYPASPVPHAADRQGLISILAVLLLLSFTTFFLVRRYSHAHPEALDQIVSRRAQFLEREEHTAWDEIGFHRPLGGFMLALMLGLVFFIPLIIYQNLILPVYILPSAQALGIWGRVTQFFNLAWMLFDMGTSAALIKYLAEYRIHDPKKGIQYAQLFVWWQMLSGTIQVAMVIVLASVWVPQSAYALYAWSIIIHSTIQLPGFYQVLRNVLTGLQRTDYAQVLDMALGVVFPMLAQPIVVTAMFAWGQANPAFGGPMGGLFGMGLAAYAAELCTFLLGLLLYRRLGYSSHVLFMVHFDWEIIRTGFRFGVFEMLGSVAWTFGQAAEIWITQTRLINYAEIWGNWLLAQNFVYAFQVLQTLYNNVMPSISESVSHGRVKLSQYYAAESYRWGGLVSAFIGAVLLAVADRFILGASGPEFVRAAAYCIPLIIWGAIQYPSWVADNVQLASNRPYLKATLIAGEQVVRILLAYALLSTFQINALIIAYFVGLLTKDFVAFAVNHRLCFPQHLYIWPSFVAPLLAGAVHFALVRWIGGMIWHGDTTTSVVIFFIGILPSFPLFAFLYAFFGGWDDGTLAELRRAADMSSIMKPLTWLFWAFSQIGATLSPLHGRFPVTVRAEALVEAQTLTAERVGLA